MKISKIINHNIVISEDLTGDEIVLMGRGIAFNKKKNETLDEALIEKRFHLEKEVMSDHFFELLREVPEDIIKVTYEVIEHIKTNMDKKIDDRIYSTLLDHVNFAVTRYLQGIQFNNMLLLEINHLYKEEIKIAKEVVLMINQKLMVKLPEDEAAFIALHIVNAQLELDIREIAQVTTLINEVLKIVRYHLKVELDESSLDYARFITHLKFFARRLLTQQNNNDNDLTLFEMVKGRYPNELRCVEVIEKHVQKVHRQGLSLSEKLYLTMHMTRIRNRGV